MDISKIEQLFEPTTERKDKLEIIKELTESRIKTITGKKVVPDELDYVVVNITMARFNRLGSEGMKSTDQEGLSFVFLESDFDEYMDDILSFKDDTSNYGKRRQGGVRFI
ncbi:head-tail connector [Weissella phage PWc]|nr:head-tail connector [Weissella phage PWc]